MSVKSICWWLALILCVKKFTFQIVMGFPFRHYDRQPQYMVFGTVKCTAQNDYLAFNFAKELSEEKNFKLALCTVLHTVKE